MKKQVYEIDEKGYIKNTYVAKVDINGALIEELEGNIVTHSPEQGMCRPRWTGVEWIEDMSQEEIEELKSQPRELSGIELLRIEQAKANAEIIELMMNIVGGGF